MVHGHRASCLPVSSLVRFSLTVARWPPTAPRTTQPTSSGTTPLHGTHTPVVGPCCFPSRQATFVMVSLGRGSRCRLGVGGRLRTETSETGSRPDLLAPPAGRLSSGRQRIRASCEPRQPGGLCSPRSG